MLRLRINSGYVLALLALMFFSQELRMMLRMLLLRWVCGCWGERGFSNWSGCTSCDGSAGVLLGVQFVAASLPFIQMWLGYWLLHEDHTVRRRAWGFALVFSALPLARLTSATLAAGPEAHALRQLLGEWGASWVLSIVLVLLLVVPPAIRAHDALSHPRRGAMFLALLVGPLLANALVVSGLLDPLLRAGLLAAHGPAHTPWLAVLWLACTALGLAASYRHLSGDAEPGRVASWLSVSGLTSRLRSRQT